MPLSEKQLRELLTVLPHDGRGGNMQSRLRACLQCKLVKTREQFIEHGCENCPTFARRSRNDVEDLTTPYFEGVVAIFDPKRSWIYRAMDFDERDLKPGIYALVIPDEVAAESVEEDEGEIEGSSDAYNSIGDDSSFE
eukprot:gnl/Chilomastix_cuspidata/4501.p2 GENE.gnl/Chilomastix_cuspidata/4501~~gnl/Chilomastix_cuspidata/4501.p2  ORF type:complete len:138 (+),score=21.85 gnl/Chilomastix_cuspidata/4501:195-608(+)